MGLNFTRKSFAGVLAMILVIAAGASLTLAQGSGSRQEATMVAVTLTGSLSSGHSGSGSKASRGPLFIILAAKDSAGEELEAYKYWRLQLMDGATSRSLLAEYADGKTVEVRGRLDVARRVLYVASFSPVDEG